MTTLFPADPCQPSQTLRDAINADSRKDLMLLEALPYLLAVLRQQESSKLRNLIDRVVKETA